MDVFEEIKNDVIELNATSKNRVDVFYADLLFQDRTAPKNSYNKSDMINAFYQVTGISPLKIYVDELKVNFIEEGFHDRYIQSLYCSYSREWGGFWTILPFILFGDLFCWFYNSFFVYPYSSIRFLYNPRCVYCNLSIIFRKSSVQQL